ncbi:MAG: hypothetical protein EOO41_02470 [Methanobacteriota archaeon]|nr:MAG: hypothetical protein EOO41_02470 [Euryarchaeota archaeon]
MKPRARTLHVLVEASAVTQSAHGAAAAGDAAAGVVTCTPSPPCRHAAHTPFRRGIKSHTPQHCCHVLPTSRSHGLRTALQAFARSVGAQRQHAGAAHRTCKAARGGGQ